jgi:aldehyde dehydrogenase
MIYAAPNKLDSKVDFKTCYGNFIGGEWVAPVKNQYFENISPVNGQV